MGKAPRIAQDLKEGSYFGGRRPEDGKIDWQWPALRIYNLIRAVTDPYPGAFTLLPEGERLFIWWAVPEGDGLPKSAVGAVGIENENVYVRASHGRIRLIDIEVAKKRMKGHDILDFFQDRKGVVLK